MKGRKREKRKCGWAQNVKRNEDGERGVGAAGVEKGEGEWGDAEASKGEGKEVDVQKGDGRGGGGRRKGTSVGG